MRTKARTDIIMYTAIILFVIGGYAVVKWQMSITETISEELNITVAKYYALPIPADSQKIYSIDGVLYAYQADVIPETTEPEITAVLSEYEGIEEIEPETVIIKPTETPSEGDGEWLEFSATNYCKNYCCCEGWALNRPLDENGKEIVYTASGEIAEIGYTIGADWSVLPKFTLIEIENMGIYQVHDKGSGVKGNGIDIYIENCKESDWGRRTVRIRIIEGG